MVTVVDQAARLLAQLIGVALLGGILAAAAAAAYRWYVDETVPGGLALLVGLSGVAIYLNTTTALGQVIGGSITPTETEAALFNIAAFATGVGGAGAGRHLGDRFAVEIAETVGGRAEEDVGRLVRTVGRVITVELPAEIDDVVGYDPVPEATKETLAGKTFVFPRGLTVEELRERLVSRLTTDYAVGHVDVELTADGTVEHLGLGSRAAGIGPTLPPATNAVAVRADPAFAASTGDIVQVWETDPMRRITTAELRGVAGDVATVAIDAADTPKLDPTVQYRLVTLPVEDRPDREFASLLRAADETFASVTVAAGSPLHGLPVGGLDLAVVAIKPEDGAPVPTPPRDRQLDPGDVIFAIATPEALRRLDDAARPLEPSLASETAPADSTEPTDAPAEPASPDPGVETADATDEGRPATGAAETDDVLDDPPAGDDGDDAGSVEAESDDFDDLEPLSIGDEGTGDDDASADSEGLDGFSFGGDEDGLPEETDRTDTDSGSGDSAVEQDGEENDNADDNKGEGASDEELEDEGANKSFQELKEEFESGEAEWEDDLDDNSGGDVRPDE